MLSVSRVRTLGPGLALLAAFLTRHERHDRHADNGGSDLVGGLHADNDQCDAPQDADDCERHENGGQTTHNAKPVPWPVPLGSKAADDAMAYLGTLTCKAQFDTHIMDFITRLWPRRLTVVDEQKGLVFAFPMFNQEANAEGRIHLKNVPGLESMALGATSSNLQAGEMFKIRGGQIHEIEAMGVNLPYGQKSGWD